MKRRTKLFFWRSSDVSDTRKRPAKSAIWQQYWIKRGLSQERLAFDAEVDRSYVGGLERQEQNPTVDLLDRLSQTLQVSLAELFREPAKNAPRPKPLRRGRRPLK
jgi:ribosome-binding protein aMBF1 (putative translation factor)